MAKGLSLTLPSAGTSSCESVTPKQQLSRDTVSAVVRLLLTNAEPRQGLWLGSFSGERTVAPGEARAV
jgi:hypothetical protein